MRQKGHYANKLYVCQGQAKPESYAVAAVTTNNHEEDDEEEDGHKTLFEFCRCHQGDGKVSNSWILLDNQSTIDVFCKKSMLTNIRKVPTQMNIHSNGCISTPIRWVTLQVMEWFGITRIGFQIFFHLPKLEENMK